MAVDDGWQADAACRGISNPDIFFPDVDLGQKIRAEEAKAVCRECPVKVRCLGYAIVHKVSYGVWGGRTPRERWQIPVEIKDRLRRWWRSEYPVSTSRRRRYERR